MQRTQIYLTEEQAGLLDARAEAAGRTRSDLIREAIDAWLGRKPKTASALRDTLMRMKPLEVEGFEESRAAMWREYEAGLDAKLGKAKPTKKKRK
jgi:hypothetical protein